MQLSRYEQETIINYNEEEATASVYTHNVALLRKLEKMAQAQPDKCRLERTSHGGRAADYIIPKAWVRITPTRQMSEARLQALEKARLAQKSLVGAGPQARDALRVGMDTTPATPSGNPRETTEAPARK